MTSSEIALVQESFRKMSPSAGSLVALFYTRLFELEPNLRRLCSGAMEAKSRRVVRTLARLVAQLDQLDGLRPALRRIGSREAWHGVREGHYASAGAALLWTLERALGIEFTPALRAAWNRCYVELACAMLEGVRPRDLAA